MHCSSEALRPRFRTLRAASTSLVAMGAERRGITLSPEFAERLGLLITSPGNGLALEKLIDPDAVSDEAYGDMLVLLFNGLVTLARSDRGEKKAPRRKDRANANVGRQSHRLAAHEDIDIVPAARKRRQG